MPHWMLYLQVVYKGETWFCQCRTGTCLLLHFLIHYVNLPPNHVRVLDIIKIVCQVSTMPVQVAGKVNTIGVGLEE